MLKTESQNSTALQKIGTLLNRIEPHTENSVRSKLFIICFVTFVASFDFTIFVFLSDSLSITFFAESGDEFSQQLKLVSLVAIGFIARPFGALLLGRYADIKGRKPVLHIGLFLLFLTSIVAACLPTYSQVGVTASVLLVIVRLIQGAAFANQLGLGWVYVAESLPRSRLATCIGMVCGSSALGVIFCALMITYLNFVFSDAQLVAFAWRIPFVISGLMAFIGYLLVHKLSETTLFMKHKSDSIEPIELSSFTYDLKRFNAYFLTFFLTLIYSSSMILLLLLLPKFINSQVSIDEFTLRILSAFGMIGLALGMLFYGWLADKINLGRVLMVGSILLCLNAVLLYYYLSHGHGTYLVPIFTMVGFSNGIISLCPMIFLQLFPTQKRLMCTNVIFNVITVFTGVILPFSLLYITEIISFAPAMYLIFIGVCAFFMGFYVYQTPQLVKYQQLSASE